MSTKSDDSQQGYPTVDINDIIYDQMIPKSEESTEKAAGSLSALIDTLNTGNNSLDVTDQKENIDQQLSKLTVAVNGLGGTHQSPKKTTLNCIQLSPPIDPSANPPPSSIVQLSPPLPPSLSVGVKDTVCSSDSPDANVKCQDNTTRTRNSKGKRLQTGSTGNANRIEAPRPSLNISNGVNTRNNNRQAISNIPQGSLFNHPSPASISVNVNDTNGTHLSSKCISASNLLLQTCSPQISSSQSTSRVVDSPTSSVEKQSLATTINKILQNKDDISDRSFEFELSPLSSSKRTNCSRPKDTSRTTHSRSSSPEIIILDDDTPLNVRSDSFSKTSSIDSSKRKNNRLGNVATNNITITKGKYKQLDSATTSQDGLVEQQWKFHSMGIHCSMENSAFTDVEKVSYKIIPPSEFQTLSNNNSDM